jgi:hypothetical protein
MMRRAAFSVTEGVAAEGVAAGISIEVPAEAAIAYRRPFYIRES